METNYTRTKETQHTKWQWKNETNNKKIRNDRVNILHKLDTHTHRLIHDDKSMIEMDSTGEETETKTKQKNFNNNIWEWRNWPLA